MHLRDQSTAVEATFVPAAGMLCSSLRHRGEELLAQNAGVQAYARTGATMGIPLLYPWANRLGGFDYSFAGRSVTVPHDTTRVALDDHGLPIHGVIGGRVKWQLVRLPEGDACSLTAHANWDDSQPHVFEVFPFRHELDYVVRLLNGGLEIEVTVHACGGEAVPVAFGFHPYLALPGAPRAGWLVELPAMRHLRLDANQIPVGPERELSRQRFELDEREFDDGFDSLAQPARFSVAVGDRQIELEFLTGYPCAQVFAPPARQFICFEPMTAPANALRSGAGLRLLEPGERYRACFSVRVSDRPPDP
jgi:galactose mutarotase-like enzyme